jgi:hypothetical protein
MHPQRGYSGDERQKKFAAFERVHGVIYSTDC